jgi:NADH:ubiquinone oxidoreductase subunit C
MDKISSMETAEAILQPMVERFGYQGEYRLDAYISVHRLLEAVQILLNNGWIHLSAITGVDLPAPGPAAAGAPASENPPALHDVPEIGAQDAAESRIELLYHFCLGPAILTLRTSLAYSNPVAPSICGLLSYATLYERELIEMFGVTFEGTPDTSRLLLPDDWPDGVYPLRKDFTG